MYPSERKPYYYQDVMIQIKTDGGSDLFIKSFAIYLTNVFVCSYYISVLLLKSESWLYWGNYDLLIYGDCFLSIILLLVNGGIHF